MQLLRAAILGVMGMHCCSISFSLGLVCPGQGDVFRLLPLSLLYRSECFKAC